MRPPFFTEVDALREQAQQLKRLLEGKRWTELGALLDLPQVWVFDRPFPPPQAVALAESVLAEAQDIHLYVERILKAETEGDRGHLSLNCCLMWGEPQGLKDHEFELDLHLGFGRTADGAWSIRYLGVTPGTPEEIPFPEDPREAPGAAASAQTPPGPLLAAPESGPIPPGHVLAYLPVVVPAGALRAAPGSAPAGPEASAEEHAEGESRA
jgi:hypothetical protein